MLSFAGRTVVITGAGGALGRSYALEFARRGAQLLINDVGASSVTGGGDLTQTAAANVVNEIVAGGGKATANYNNVASEGAEIIESALRAYGKVDVLVNNAGNLRDKSFHKMEKSDWDSVLEVHLQGTFSLCHAVWPHMQKNNFGRIINIGSGAGLYGNFGQSNYSAAKMGIVGLSNTLAKEGEKYNIHVNCVVPIAGSRMTATVLPPSMLALLEPEHIAPIVSYLCHDSCSQTGEIFEVGGGWYSKVRLQRSAGASLGGSGKPCSAEDIERHMPSIADFSTNPTYPQTAADALRDMMAAAATGSSATPFAPAAGAGAAARAEAPAASKTATLLPLQCDAMFRTLETHVAASSANAASFQSKVKALVAFTFEDARGQVQKKWVIDGRQSVPTITMCAPTDASAPAKPACTITLSDDTFIKLTSGALSTEVAYMRGLIKITGSMGVAMKMKALLELAGQLAKTE